MRSANLLASFLKIRIQSSEHHFENLIFFRQPRSLQTTCQQVYFAHNTSCKRVTKYFPHFHCKSLREVMYLSQYFQTSLGQRKKGTKKFRCVIAMKTVKQRKTGQFMKFCVQHLVGSYQLSSILRSKASCIP